RIDDRLPARLDAAWHDQTGLAGIDVDLEIDPGEDRLLNLLQHRREDLKERGARLGVLTANDAQQRFPLRGTCTLVDEEGGMAMAFMDRTRKIEHADEFQAIELGIAVMP